MMPERNNELRRKLNARKPLKRSIELLVEHPSLKYFSRLIRDTRKYSTDHVRFRMCSLLELIPESFYTSEHSCLGYCQQFCPLFCDSPDEERPDTCDIIYSGQKIEEGRDDPDDSITAEQYWDKNQASIILSMIRLLAALDTIDTWPELGGDYHL